MGLPHRLAELHADGLPVAPRVTGTPKPCPTWAELARSPARGPRVWCGVVWCGMVWCGVVCLMRCYQKAMAGMSTHG